MDELIVRSLTGVAAPIEERRLAAWRAESPDHERQYVEVAAIWSAGTPDASDSVAGHAPPPPALESVVRRSEAIRRRESRGRSVRRIAPRGAWAAAAAIVALIVGIRIGGGSGADGALGGTEFSAGPLEASTVSLSDGSFVRLDAGSTVRFEGGDDRREAWLTGRAFFGVAADPGRPFIVHTDLGETRVLGTRFEVASRPGELRVIVVEGRVSVRSTLGRSTEVGKGQVALLSANGDFSVTTVEDVYGLLDWEAGVLVFQGTPLAQVAEEVAAHFGVTLTVAPDLAGRTITAWFGDDPLAEVTTSICLLVQAECDVRGDTVAIGRN